MSGKRHTITSQDRLAEARQRDNDLGRLPGDGSLRDWIENWLQSGAVATSEVLQGRFLDGHATAVVLFACQGPLTLEEYIDLFAVHLGHLKDAGLYLSGRPILPAEKPNPAPSSNTGLSGNDPSNKAGDDGVWLWRLGELNRLDQMD